MSTAERIGAGRFLPVDQTPVDTTTTVHELSTEDGKTVSGVLRTVPGARTVACIMHPRRDSTHHPLVPELLTHGIAVWTQGPRSVNDDIALVHEQALLDVAAGQRFLREQGFAHVLTVGHSGGATLFAYYHEQAAAPPGERVDRTPTGRATGLPEAELPIPDGAIFMAPHPGQGILLQRLIDPSVTDEANPLSVDPDLDPYAAANGFAEPPTSSSYASEFVDRYRAAQLTRVRRLDERAREMAAEAGAARARWKDDGRAVDRRISIAPRVLTVYRTDADLRCVDLSLDPNDRPYGSLFGRRPDLTNYGLVGFARFCTPDAWLSTWSGTASNAAFLRCAAGVTAPTLLMEFTGDQACFPSDIADMRGALGADDVTFAALPGTHFGGSLTEGAPSGISLAAGHIRDWVVERFPTGDGGGSPSLPTRS